MAKAHLKKRDERTAPLIVYRSVDGSGSTYALNRRDRERLKAQLGEDAHLPPRVFIAHETEADSTTLHGSLRRSIVQLLTGLPEDRLGSLDIEFRDPVTERLVG